MHPYIPQCKGVEDFNITDLILFFLEMKRIIQQAQNTAQNKHLDTFPLWFTIS